MFERTDVATGAEIVALRALVAALRTLAAALRASVAALHASVAALIRSFFPLLFLFALWCHGVPRADLVDNLPDFLEEIPLFERSKIVTQQDGAHNSLLKVHAIVE
ncbi:hypothetical protein G5I_02301 [Acromyrmex echinatior]|uniref:Uncharacterized protein n=1 Tax=Acromyrmex echinatior TaxID=103372 RepID=F4W9Z1_ACREC|nr:hypothetical protein G5I_02301 [Acromyrmex echinatior]